MTQDCNDIWAQCLLTLEQRLRPQTFNTWFRPTRVRRLDADGIVIEVPSSYFAEWLESRYLDLLQQVIASVTGSSPPVSFVIPNAQSSAAPQQHAEPSAEALSPALSSHPSTRSGIATSISSMPASDRPVDSPFSSLNERYTFDTFVIGEGTHAVIIAMGCTYWVGVCRIVRGEVLKLKGNDYVLAARALGLSDGRIIFQHVMPNVMHLVIISFTLLFVQAIKAEVVISFLGVGVVDLPSWGLMIQDATAELTKGHWWQMAFTSLALFAIVLAFQVFGDALRDALDPRLRH